MLQDRQVLFNPSVLLFVMHMEKSPFLVASVQLKMSERARTTTSKNNLCLHLLGVNACALCLTLRSIKKSHAVHESIPHSVACSSKVQM